MPTHAEIERKLDELMMVRPIDEEALDVYFRTLSTEDRMHAAHYGAARAGEDMQRLVAGWLS